MTAYFATVAACSVCDRVVSQCGCLSGAARPVGRLASLGLPGVWHRDPVARQHSGLVLAVAPWAVSRLRDPYLARRYPVVEAATGLLVRRDISGDRPGLDAPRLSALCGTTMVLVLTDLDHKRIPNRILYPATVAGVLLLTARSGRRGTCRTCRGRWPGEASTSVCSCIALAARGGFGMGDVKLAFLLGSFLAFQSWNTSVVRESFWLSSSVDSFLCSCW